MAISISAGTLGSGPGAVPTYRVAEVTNVKDGFRQYSIEAATTTKFQCIH